MVESKPLLRLFEGAGHDGGCRMGFYGSAAMWALIALITLFGFHSCTPVNVERALETAVQSALRANGHAFVTVDMRGQTAVLGGVTPSEEAKRAAGQIASRAAGAGGAWMGGVTRVDNKIIIGAPVSPYTWSATRDPEGRVVLRGHAPSNDARAAIVERARGLFKSAVDETVVAPGAPTSGDWVAVASDALEQLATLSSGAVRLSDANLTIVGEAEPTAADAVRAFYAKGVAGGFKPLVDLMAPGQAVEIPGLTGIALTANAQAGECQKAFGGLMARNVINFDSGSAVISQSSQQLLSDLGRVARRCDQYAIEIAGHTDDRGDRALNMRLSRDRAQAVVTYLIGQGVAPERLEAVGFGPDRPRAPNRTPAGQAQNRRIEFTVKS